MIILVSNMPLGKESAHQNQNFRPPHPLESKMLRTKLRRTPPPPTTVWQENLVSNDGFFGLSLSVLRGGGRPVGWKDISMRPKEGGRGSKGSVRNLTGLGKKTTSYMYSAGTFSVTRLACPPLQLTPNSTEYIAPDSSERRRIALK